MHVPSGKGVYQNHIEKQAPRSLLQCVIHSQIIFGCVAFIGENNGQRLLRIHHLACQICGRNYWYRACLKRT